MDHNQHNQLSSSKRKQEMRLDLKSGGPTGRKRSKLNSSSADVLSTPDVMKLNLPTPDLEKFIIQGQPGGGDGHPLVTPSQVFFPKNVTEEQELYAKGFVDALAQLQQHQENTNSNSTFSDSTSNLSFDTTTHSSTVSGVPINMENQEKIKLERKRQRNRVAASKCRKRKLERIAKLEDKVKLLKDENNGLGEVLNRLKNRVNELKDNIRGHQQLGCNILIKCEVD